MSRNLCLLFASVFLMGPLGYAQSSYSSPETGEKVLGTYFATDVDTVSTTTGNLHVSIPLFSLPGRELPLSVAMDYNSQLYEYRIVNDPILGVVEYWEFLGWRKNTGVGGILNAAKTWGNPYFNGGSGTWQQNVNLTITWIEWDGTKHKFTKTFTRQCPIGGEGNICQGATPPDSEIYDNHTIDSGESEFLRLSTGTHFSSGSVPAKVFFKDGRYMNITARSTNTRNGNYLTGNASTQTVSVVPAGGVPTSLADYLPTTDTMGRSIGWSDNGTTQTISLTDANGQAKTYQINWTTLTLNNNSHPCVWQVNTQFRVISSIVLPNGRSYSFQYDQYGYLNRLTFPSGAYIRYSYSYGEAIVGLNCRFWVTARIVSSDGTGASEKVTTYSYTLDGSGTVLLSTTVTHPAGNSQLYDFSSGLNSKVRFRDSGGNTLKTVDRSWVTGTNPKQSSEKTTIGNRQSERKYFYDSYNNVTQEEHYDWGTGGVGSFLRYITRSYSASNQTYLDNWILTRPLTETIYTAGGVTIANTESELDNYGGANSLITRSGSIPGWTDPGSNIRGNITHVKRWLNTNGSWLNTIHRYDVLGNIATVTDPAGHATQMDFTDNFMDGLNRFTYAQPKRVTDPNGTFVDTKYDFNTGLAREMTDVLGRTSTTTYDVMNRTRVINEPGGGRTEYIYDDVTPKVTKEVKVDTQNNLGRGVTTFDKLYRAIKTETSDPSGNIFVETQYDNNGRKWKVSNPYRTGETVIWTQFQYDALDRPTVTTAPDNSAIQYAYSDNQTTVTDEGGNQRRYTYDGVGRMTTVEEPNPTLSTPLITTYTYNAAGKLIQTTQGAQTRTFNFDSLGRMTSQVLPESGTTSFTYNADSLLLTKTDARNVTTTMSYHATHVHKTGTRSYSDSTPSVSYSYDTAGRQTQMTDGLGTVLYSYVTGTDRLYQEQRSLMGITGWFSTTYVYNIKGDLTQMTYPSGRVVNFNYATGGGCCNSRLSSIVDQTTNTTLNSSLSYNAAGETLSHTLGNGLLQSYTYNNRLQLTGITSSLSGTSLMNVGYDYGTSTQNTGRILSRTDNIQQEHSTKYTYDSIYRLAQVVANDASWGTAWTFDTWGNRLTQTPQGLATSKIGTQTSGYTNNRLNGNTYDTAGNQTNDGLHNYAFNAENQITQMDGGTAVYGYDGEGRRMKKTVGSETTYYFYGVGGLLCEFTTTNTGATQAASTDRTTYRTSDKLGSAVLIINASGTVIENNRTLPYGEAWLPEVSSTNEKKFTTYQRDQESGLDYAGARYLANATGRFNSPDKGSINPEIPSSLNRYTYTLNDPINLADPDGNDVICTGPYRYFYINGEAGPRPANVRFCFIIPPSFAPIMVVRIPSLREYDDRRGRLEAQGRFARAGITATLTNFDQSQTATMERALLAAAAVVSQFSDCAKLFGGKDAFMKSLNSITFSPSSHPYSGSRDPRVSPGEWDQQVNNTWAFGVEGTTNVYMNDRFFDLDDISQEAFVILHEVWHVNAPDSERYIDSRARGAGLDKLLENCNVSKPPNL